ncbi:alkaline phosphatase [Vibrio mangrovi]|uniref:Alkaline phosphatase n=1 Tax=Vibrio mangrovi TaxID=474394 RepID=A0A1Y6IZ94_9VIBR|nr:alkaline phosphatase [Vibrio mangrovi]MDW6005082.1 alkaline phosphatase [Vibrio mangrovi]SMS02995.1 Alkaline phosphatase precursor [Vibrio mangrovi]
MKNNHLLLASGLMASLVGCTTSSETAQINTPQKSDVWFVQAQQQIAKAKANKPIDKPAKNVILFVGDGMSIGTITAARIYEGQRRGMLGEEYKLTMEQLPYVALSKTYNTNAQTPDSAGTASAMVTGVKTKQGIISVDDNVRRGFCNTQIGHEAKTAWEMAAEKGLSVGVVSTARITHATPATTYAHAADRDWENDSKLPNIAKNQGCIDIAQQLINFNGGKGMDVVFGGGRREFIPATTVDPDGKKGKRKDGRNLIAEWQVKHPGAQYVYDKAGFDTLNKNTKQAFGLFESSHMKYEADRRDGEPSVAEMTAKAIDILSKNKDGYLLMVEGGRIDHAHHAGNAARALADTVAYDDAIKAALDKTNPEDTLIIVTADHAHTLISNGYADRGNPILGLSKKNGQYNVDDYGRRYTTLSYGNGPGAVNGARSNPTQEEVLDLDYRQQSLIKLSSETHSGEDVAIFARGPEAYLFQGAVEQNYIFHVMNEALGLTK